MKLLSLSVLLAFSIGGSAQSYLNYAPQWAADQVTFYSDRDGDWELFLMNSDGSNLQKLTNNTFYDADPSFDPKGEKILFVSDRGGSDDIYALNIQSGETTRFTNDSLSESSPKFSPNSRLIGYVVEVEGKNDLRVLDMEDQSEIVLLSGIDWIGRFTWSPDSEQIAVTVDFNGKNYLWILNAKSKDRSEIKTQVHPAYNPSWSPDGRHILFDSHSKGLSESGDSQWEIFLLEILSGDISQLTDNKGDNWGSDWSDNGEQIVFAGGGRNNTGYEIYKMDRDGKNIRRLTFGNDHPGIK